VTIITEGVSSKLKFSETPLKTEINKRVLSEYVPEARLQEAYALAEAAESQNRSDGSTTRPTVHVVVLGHVDAGKSTLMGRLLYDMGIFDDKTVRRLQRETKGDKVPWAWALDQRPEERVRGVTMDVAVARCETKHRHIVILDAPGHRDFIPRMIGGAAQAEAALLVVDGAAGGFDAESFRRQDASQTTREHAQLARSLGIDQIAVVVTKLDTEPDAQQAEQRFENIKAALNPFLVKHCGFGKPVLWLPAIATTGENVVHDTSPGSGQLGEWFTGPSVVDALDSFHPATRLVHLPLRVVITEVMSATGNALKSGTVTVAGKVETGGVMPGMTALLMPSSGSMVTVTGILVEANESNLPLARAGDSVEVTVQMKGPSGTPAVGDILCHPDFPVSVAYPATGFEARIVLMDTLTGPIIPGWSVTLHVHASQEPARIEKFLRLVDGTSGETIRERPRCLTRGQTAVVVIVPVSRAVCVETYAEVKALGRIALREGGKTLGVGIVTAVYPPLTDNLSSSDD
jgi:elongation factor 1 alpha-like protein